MNATELLVMYERVADAPDAVKKMRQLVLELAVRGQLVEQSASLAPEVDSSDSAPRSVGITEGERFVDVPTLWSWKRISEIGSLAGGMTPTMGRAEYWDGDIVWLSPKDIKASEVSNSELKITAKGLSETRLKLFPPGSLFIVARSGILKRTLPVAINTVAATANQDLKVLVPFQGSLSRYLQIMLRGFERFILNRLVKTGTTVQSLRYDEFEYQAFPLPPLAEQHRIVAKVDELMALCDQLEAARTERESARDRLAAVSLARLNAPDPDTFQSDARFALDVLPALSARTDQVKQLRQTILNIAVRGKLVRREKTAQKSLVGTLSVLERPADLPADWGFEKLESLLSEDTRNGYSRRPDDAPNGTPILRISAGTVRRDGVVAEEEHKLISGIDQSVREQYGVRAGDLLACRFNGNKSFVGRLTLFDDYLQLRPIYPDKLIRVRVDPTKVLATFIRYAGESDLIRSEIEAQCATTVGNWGISATNLKSIHFPVPPLAEQHEIVSKLDQLMSLCDRLEASLEAGANDRSRLLDSLLHDALRPDHDSTVVAAASSVARKQRNPRTTRA